jgi:hypothetical protein
MQRPQRNRVLFTKARENELNTQLDPEPTSAEAPNVPQPRTRKQTQTSQNVITNNVPKATKNAGPKKSTKSRKKKQTTAAGAPPESPIPAPKFRSILAQEKSARELR